MMYHILGTYASNTYHQALACFEFLASQKGVTYTTEVEPEPVFEQKVAEQTKKFASADGQRHTRLTGGDCLIWKDDDEYVGGSAALLAWAKKEHGYEDKTPPALYRGKSVIAMQQYAASMEGKRRFAYMDFGIGYEKPKRVVIELFFDIVPKTCTNFLGLCDPVADKLGYKNTLVHRVVKNGWIQAGDVRNSDGDGGFSIYGRFFEDENFALSHTWAGDVAMANSGPHSNGSQFYITCAAMPWLDKKKVVFGRVFSGMGTIRRIEKLEVAAWNQRPTDPIVTIVACGEYKMGEEKK